MKRLEPTYPCVTSTNEDANHVVLGRKHNYDWQLADSHPAHTDGVAEHVGLEETSITHSDEVGHHDGGTADGETRAQRKASDPGQRWEHGRPAGHVHR